MILARYEQEGETFLQRIITADESYVHPVLFTSAGPLNTLYVDVTSGRMRR
jgi:hypothetical protein